MPKNVINKKTYNITNEIDYKKLAEAIVSAQEKQNFHEQEESAVATPFAIICSTFFLLSSIFMGMLTIGFLAIPVVAFCGLYPLFLEKLPSSAFVVFVLTAISALFCYLLWKAFKSMSSEKDKSFIISIFSGMSSFAALIIAVLTLFYTINQ